MKTAVATVALFAVGATIAHYGASNPPHAQPTPVAPVNLTQVMSEANLANQLAMSKCSSSAEIHSYRLDHNDWMFGYAYFSYVGYKAKAEKLRAADLDPVEAQITHCSDPIARRGDDYCYLTSKPDEIRVAVLSQAAGYKADEGCLTYTTVAELDSFMKGAFNIAHHAKIQELGYKE